MSAIRTSDMIALLPKNSVIPLDHAYGLFAPDNSDKATNKRA